MRCDLCTRSLVVAEMKQNKKFEMNKQVQVRCGATRLQWRWNDDDDDGEVIHNNLNKIYAIKRWVGSGMMMSTK